MELEKELLIFDGRDPRDSVCRIERVSLKDGRTLVIAEELDENPGLSVTEAWEGVVQAVKSRYRLDEKNIVWVEFYDIEREAVTEPNTRWQLVTFSGADKGVRKGKVAWRDMTADDWRELGLEPRP